MRGTSCQVHRPICYNSPMKLFHQNRNLVIIALIAIVNALGYGIIIPVLYTYSQRFGLSDFHNGLLFSIFSFCQFFATPIIGRMSDMYGRKPLLVVSILGTAGSFFLMAYAPNAFFLFFARALDGITAGNIPVASAVISDTTAPKDRAKGFGIIGASFGFGFIFGPAISALTLGYGANVPFIIAGIVALIAAAATAFFLPETNKHRGLVKHGKLIDFSHLYRALLDKNIGTTLFLSFIYTIAFGLIMYAYQPLAVRVLGMTPAQVSLNFTLIGVVGLIAQVLIIPRIVHKFGETITLRNALFLEALVLVGFFLTRSLVVMTIVTMVHALANSFINPLIGALLSKEVDEHSQGTIQGVNASYMSIGLILGPIIGGTLATITAPLPFLAGAFAVFGCVLLAQTIDRKLKGREVPV